MIIETVRRLILRLYPELRAGHHLPTFAVVVLGGKAEAHVPAVSKAVVRRALRRTVQERGDDSTEGKSH